MGYVNDNGQSVAGWDLQPIGPGDGVSARNCGVRRKMANNTIETRRPDKRSANAEAPRREPKVRVEAAPVRGRPANENDPGSSMMLAKLRRQPSYAPYYAAFFLSLAWIAGWFFTFSNTLTATAGTLPEIMRAIALLALPIGIGWVVAYFLWRAAQLRQVSEVLMQSAMRLIRPQDIATEGITTIAQAVRSEVDLLVGGVEHAVQRATALEEIVHKEIAAIERAFGGNEDRIRSLVAGIENQRTALHQAGLIINNDANPMLTRLETNTHHLDTVIGNAHATLGKLEKGMRETTVDLARAIDEVSGRAAAAGEEIVSQTSQLERTSNVMTGELREFSRHLADQIGQLTHATGSLNTETSEFGRHVQGVEAALTQTVRQSIEQLTGVHHDIAHSVDRAAVASADQMKQTAANLTEVIETAGSGISYHLKDTAAEATATIERAGTDTARQIDQSRVLIAQGLQAVTTEYLDNVAKSRAGLIGYLDSSSNDIAGAINQATEAVATNINAASAQFLSGIDQTANNLISELTSTGTGLAGRVEQTTGRLFTEIGARAEYITTNLQTVSSQLFEQLENSMSSVAVNLNETGQRFQGLIGGTSEDMEARIDSAAERLYGHMNATVDSVSGKIGEVTSSVNGLLVTTSGTIAAHLKETAEIVNRQMQDSGIALASNIESSGGIITEKLISVSGSFALNVTQTREELTELLIANTKMMTERLDTTATDMTNAFAETAVRVTSQVNEANSLMGQRLEKTSAEVTSQLGSTSTQIIREIGKASEAFSEGLGQTTQQITGRLEQDAGLLMDRVGRVAKELERTSADVTSQLDSRSTQVIGEIGKASDAFSEGLGQTTLQITGRLEQDTGLLVDRVDRAAKGLDSISVNTAVLLDEAHRKFSQHVETANTYLADQLSTAANTIDERLEGISMNLSGKLEMTSSRVSERLEDVTSLVERSIGKFNEEMERVLINRKDALDLLIGDAAKRADEVDAVMTSYMKLIENSLASSEARSKDIGRVVAEQTALAAANLQQEIGKLEAASGGQISQISDVLRDQHERAMAAMNEMLSATATDFQQTAQDMRITAQQVVKEIDGARTEMKRAIVGLPEETRSNADAMRRVVSDQISALNALAEVVKRQTGTLDLSGPGIALQRGFSPGKSEGQAPHNGTAGSQQKNTDGEGGGELRGRILADLAQSTARIAEPGRAAPARAVSKAAPQSLPQDMEALIDKLNVAARDLVEAIDGSLPRDLEKRFAGGERGVYTSRLYEGRGKRLQKLLVERYGNDRQVRGRIDASIRLFEQLLDMMSAASQGDAMLEACLASESGRIYVMLAEASGRLPSQ